MLGPSTEAVLTQLFIKVYIYIYGNVPNLVLVKKVENLKWMRKQEKIKESLGGLLCRKKIIYQNWSFYVEFLLLEYYLFMG